MAHGHEFGAPQGPSGNFPGFFPASRARARTGRAGLIIRDDFTSRDACRETRCLRHGRFAGHKGAGGSRAMPQADGHPAPRATGTHFPWKRVPRPPRNILGAAQKGQILLTRGFPRWGAARKCGREEEEVAGTTAPHSQAGRRTPVLPVRGGRVRGSALPRKGAGDASTESRDCLICNKAGKRL